MQPIPKLLTLLVLTLFLAVDPAPVDAAGGSGVRMEILVDGSPMPELSARGTTYIEAIKGREYAIRLTNTEGVRMAVALAVDGRNSIDAKRSKAKDASKWVLDPYESITVSGWQTGHDSAHRFLFTTEESSYAKWLGDSSNLGVIEAVAYREKPQPVAQVTPGPRHDPDRLEKKPGDSYGSRGGMGKSSRESSLDEAAAPEPSLGAESEASAPKAKGDSDSGNTRRDRRSSARDLRPAPAPKEEYAATGFGREMTNRVERIQMQLEDQPAGTARIRYEYRAALVKLGVLPDPDPLVKREVASGFDDSDFAPIPPGRR